MSDDALSFARAPKLNHDDWKNMNDDELYFAYGSNLNQDDWRNWCEKKREDPDSISAERSGWLVDHRPIYHYKSTSRGGGALDVTSALGQVTPGVLFRVRGNGWCALDRKEGHPGYYARKKVTILLEDGAWQTAVTYCVVSERRQGFTVPTPEYTEIVRQGLEQWELPTAEHDCAARNEPPAPMVRHLFVYGLLQSGQSLGQSLGGIADRQPAWIRGRLFDLGAYPGWQPANDAKAAVHGELLVLADPAATLTETDRIEGCADYTDHALYHRVLVRANMEDGEGVLAWCYRLVKPEGAPLIPAGLWPPGR
jgi:gamma-glutamylcyclotransferase (GGCT)/AIG2-like uncharacterized protein YtfP